MKIGQVDWDNMFLDFIKMTDRQDILDALDPYYDAFKKEKNLSQEYNKRYEEAVRSVKHLENKSSLSEDEFNEWEGTVGWFENIGEEIGFREESLATGLIIALWKLTNHLSETTSQGLKIRSIILPQNKFDIFRIGPQVNSEYWALALNAASNYVRHSDDWNKNLLEYIRRGTGNWQVDIPDKDGDKRFGDTKRNLKILENIGLNVENLITSNNLAYTVAEKLGILNKVDVEKTYFTWVDDVYNFSKKKLGK